MTNKRIIEQTKLAFNFIQKLYFEVSYFIKEVEGLLAEEEEKFVIGRPSGYGITTRSSTGLEINNVNLWAVRKIAVFFVPEEVTQMKAGQTITKFNGTLKVLYLRVILDEKNLAEPVVYSGVLYGFVKKSDPGKWPTKFEQIMATIEYNESKVFNKPAAIEFEDNRIKFIGKVFPVNLYDINDSEQIVNKIINPTVKMFRAIN